VRKKENLNLWKEVSGIYYNYEMRKESEGENQDTRLYCIGVRPGLIKVFFFLFFFFLFSFVHV